MNIYSLEIQQHFVKLPSLLIIFIPIITSVTPAYSKRDIQTRDIQTINSQLCEQLYSRLRRISPQLVYMKIETIFHTTRYF